VNDGKLISLDGEKKYRENNRKRSQIFIGTTDLFASQEIFDVGYSKKRYQKVGNFLASRNLEDKQYN